MSTDTRATIAHWLTPRPRSVPRSFLLRILAFGLIIALSVLLGVVSSEHYGGLEFGIVVGIPVFVVGFGADLYLLHVQKMSDTNRDREP